MLNFTKAVWFRTRECKPRPHRAAKARRGLAGIGLVCAGLVAGCQSTAPLAPADICSPTVAASGWQPPEVHSTNATLTFTELVETLAAARAVLVGESHPRLDHHLTQLEIICRLHAHDPRLAIGMEFIQRPFQAATDAYVRGYSGTDQFLRRIEYFQRWGYDYRLYQPLLEFARRHGIPVIALNAAAEITAKVSHAGLDALDPDERNSIATEIVAADESYRQRMQAVYATHPQANGDSLERFTTVQLLWDETMAESGARFLQQHPDHRLVIIAGNGHTAYRNAIPDRLARRIDAPTISISQEEPGAAPQSDADYRVHSRELTLPKNGLFGALLDTNGQRVTISGLSKNSAAGDAGVRTGDRVVSIDGRRIASFIDIKLAMWRKHAGESVRLEVERAGETISYELILR